MPELPDIEVYRHGLLARIRGKKVGEAHVQGRKRMPQEAELVESVVGRTLQSIVRDGKSLRFVFDSDQILVVHLMLNGEFYIGPTEEELPAKRISMLFDDVGYLSVSDFQGLATVKLNEPPSKTMDALDPAFDSEKLQQVLGPRYAKIVKETIIDQHIVQGIGSKYSDEILWLSKIDPKSICGSLPDDAITRLHGAMQSILREATERLIALYPDKINGKMRDGLKIHYQEETPSGHKVQVKEIGGRKTYFCPEEQVLYA